ncbi:MAG: hypothetical protein PSX36_12270 [bacterium]|nr:hypothetical protein [bacterium]
MDLLIKRYLNKPSKIGVKFLYEHKAVQEYEALIAQIGNAGAALRLECVRDKINLFLVSETTGMKFNYLGLDYVTAQITSLQQEDSADLKFQFVHVFARKNALLVAKPFHRETFLNISDISFINPSGI